MTTILVLTSIAFFVYIVLNRNVVKRLLIKKIADNGQVSNEVYVEKTMLDETKEVLQRVIGYGGIGFLLGLLIGMATRNV